MRRKVRSSDDGADVVFVAACVVSVVSCKSRLVFCDSVWGGTKVTRKENCRGVLCDPSRELDGGSLITLPRR
jgi:hypothetical protein